MTTVYFRDLNPSADIQIAQEQTLGNITGLVFKLMQERHAGLQFEINLANKGWTQIVTSTYNYETKLRYLNVNAYTHLIFGKTKFRFFVLGGPFFNRLLSTSASEIPQDLEEDITFRFDKESDNLWEIGLSGGGGFVLSTGIGEFQIEGKFNLGLTNIIKETEDTDPSFSRSQSVEVVLHYLIPVFGKNKDQ